MDSRQAKEILARYRPGDTHTGDSRMAKALELARADPQLAIWFGQHCAKQVQLPNETPAFVATVPSTALANRDRAVAAAAAEAALGQPPPPQRTISVTNLILGIIVAAGLAVVTHYLIVRYTPTPANTFDSYRDRMARLVQRAYPVKIIANSQAKVRDYFKANAGAVDFNLPRNLQKLPALGGAVLSWQNQPVSLLGLDGGTGTNLYVFLINRSAFETNTYPLATQYLIIDRFLTATWTEADTVYLFVGPNDDPAFKTYLEP